MVKASPKKCPVEHHVKKSSDISYKSYLQLPAILNAQTPLSGTAGKPPAHDEMLFLVVHQTYELWFKQVLFELDRIQDIFSHKVVEDKDLRIVSAGLGRIVKILQHLVRQIDLIETMTPLDFLDFRHVFRSASGFQSLQFRELEIRFGLKSEGRACYADKSYDSYLSEDDQEVVKRLEKQKSVFEQLDLWLSRTPFVEMGGFNFWKSYRKAVTDMVDGDKKAVMADKSMSKPIQQLEINKLDNVQKQFDMLFGAKDKEKMAWRLSMKAVQAALFINLYRDQPALQAPFEILSHMMDIDETMTMWRYRHALMVQRMLGMKMGSGSSSGHDYLALTASKHRVFMDLFSLSTFMIPRSSLPKLPKNIEMKMGFNYGDKKSAA
jgi:tryptophan 2,3-dioxygenase